MTSMLSIQIAVIVVCLASTFTHAQSNSSAIGYALTGYVYKSLSPSDPKACYEACKDEEPACRSFNYKVEEQICELNNRSNLTRPGNYSASELCMYFHSVYRVRYGSSALFPAGSCAEILGQEDSIGDTRYWIQPNTSEPALEIYCHMSSGGDMTSSFDLLFPLERNISNYVISDAMTQSLTALTVSLWIKTTEAVLVPISYATGGYTNAILMYLDERGWFRFVVADQLSINKTGVLNNDKWHHICGKWSNTQGQVQLYIDGVLRLENTGIAVGVEIPHGGQLVLGQDQDIIGGEFEVRQSFAGELAHVYIWNTALDGETVKGMAQECKEFPYPGHVVGWADFAGGIHGDVIRRNLSRCHFDTL